MIYLLLCIGNLQFSQEIINFEKKKKKNYSCNFKNVNNFFFKIVAVVCLHFMDDLLSLIISSTYIEIFFMIFDRIFEKIEK